MMAKGDGAIRRVEREDNITYLVAAGKPSAPVTFVSWFAAARYCNWLHNGKPRGAQGADTTENGAYAFGGDGTPAARMTGARFFLPAEDEWYKAAYYTPPGDGDQGATYLHFAPQETGRPLIDRAQPDKVSPWGMRGYANKTWEWTESPVGTLHRAVRSGAWFLGNNKQSAGHFYCNPQISYPTIGFRVGRVTD
jgi:formylglycine-generating enzyme required for sulfatase activity